jgi:glutamate 5-kinase
MSRQALTKARRVVVKVGTNALTNSTGRFHRAHFDQLAGEIAEAAGTRQVIIVSSGAIALGVERLALPARPKDVPGKQACAAVGQSRLMRAWEEALHPKPLERLLEQGVIPVINENDTVSADEIKFGDNDTLAGLVAGLVDADLLVILSDVDGLFDSDPRKNREAKLLTRVPVLTKELLAMAGASSSKVGTGGMATKVRAAARATELGIRCVITAGLTAGRLGQVLAGEEVGTLFEPTTQKTKARAAWIAHALKARGRLRVDDGAQRAVAERHKSLLPSGVRAVEGRFDKGDPVDIVGSSGEPFARGLAAYDSDELKRIAGKKTAEIEAELGYRGLDEAVHKDDLVLL